MYVLGLCVSYFGFYSATAILIKPKITTQTTIITNTTEIQNDVRRFNQNISTELPVIYEKAHSKIISEGKDKITRNLRVEIIPLIQRKRSYGDTIKSMDDFALVRKKTHVKLPDFETGRDDAVSNDKHQAIKLKRSLSNLKDSDSDIPWNGNKNYKIEITKSKFVREKEKAKVIEKDEQNNFDPDKIDLKVVNKDLLETLQIQTDTMNRLLHQIERDRIKRTAFEDFERIKQNSEARKNSSRVLSDEPPTFMPTMELAIDETSVKKALKNDPYIQRILKLSNLKKMRYLNDKDAIIAENS